MEGRLGQINCCQGLSKVAQSAKNFHIWSHWFDPTSFLCRKTVVYLFPLPCMMHWTENYFRFAKFKHKTEFGLLKHFRRSCTSCQFVIQRHLLFCLFSLLKIEWQKMLFFEGNSFLWKTKFEKPLSSSSSSSCFYCRASS